MAMPTCTSALAVGADSRRPIQAGTVEFSRRVLPLLSPRKIAVRHSIVVPRSTEDTENAVNRLENLPVSSGIRGEDDMPMAEKRSIVDQIIKIMERLKLMTEYPSENTQAMAATTTVVVEEVKNKTETLLRHSSTVEGSESQQLLFELMRVLKLLEFASQNLTVAKKSETIDLRLKEIGEQATGAENISRAIFSLYKS